MTYYVRDWGRPVGVEPTIFSSFEEADKPNHMDENPFGCSVEEFSTYEEAKKFVEGSSA